MLAAFMTNTLHFPFPVLKFELGIGADLGHPFPVVILDLFNAFPTLHLIEIFDFPVLQE